MATHLPRFDCRVHGYPSYTTRMCTAIRRFEDHMAGVHCSVSCVCGPVPNHVLGPRGIFRGVGSWRRGRGAYLLLLSITQPGLHARLGWPIPAIHWGTARDLCLHTPLWVARLLGLHVPTCTDDILEAHWQSLGAAQVLCLHAPLGWHSTWAYMPRRRRQCFQVDIGTSALNA